MRTSGPANPTFDFKAYLDFLQQHHHNCFRLWPWENAASFNSSGAITDVQEPMPYRRPGLGLALAVEARSGPRLTLTVGPD